MKHLIFVNACPRGEASRSLRLARCLLSAVQGPEVSVETVDLSALALVPLTGADIAARDASIKSGDTQNPIFRLANQFKHADAVIVAAPYWDMSFPSSLRVYLEHLFTVGLTFHYDEQGAVVGDCRPERLVYVTTRGGTTQVAPDFACPYLEASCQMLGVRRFDCLAAEGLDIVGNDAEALMQAAEREAERLAMDFWQVQNTARRVIL